MNKKYLIYFIFINFYKIYFDFMNYKINNFLKNPSLYVFVIFSFMIISS
ncbi:MAG: hypothetical protein Q8830_00090 [Candidatus Phytoplasma australasiaticum]|nr:hypothetical protein [Candidatus Phytoplasma australasiaticum]